MLKIEKKEHAVFTSVYNTLQVFPIKLNNIALMGESHAVPSISCLKKLIEKTCYVA